MNVSRVALVASILSAAIVTSGCATTSGGASQKSLQDVLGARGPAPAGKSVVVLYRNTEKFLSPMGVDILVDGRKLVNLSNKSFQTFEVESGVRKITASIPSEIANCTKNIEFSQTTVNFLKVSDNPRFSPGLLFLSPLASAIKDNIDEKESGCGGMVESVIVDRATAEAEIKGF